MIAGLFLMVVLALWVGDLSDLWGSINTSREALLNLPLADAACKK